MTTPILFAVLCWPIVDAKAHSGFVMIATRAYSPTIMDPVIFANLWRSWDTPSREAAAQASPQARKMMTLERYGLLEAPYDNGGAPLGMVVQKDGNYAMNCLICHAGAVEGQTILGLPNPALDFSAIYEDVGKTVAILHGKNPGNPRFPEGLVTMSAGKDPARVSFPEGLLSVSRGTTNSFTFSVHFLSHRDDDLNVLDTPLDLKPLNHYLDPPPWWHTAKKTAFYSDAFIPKDVRALMQFSLDPSVDPERFKSWEQDYQAIYAWLHTIQSPRYTGSVDHKLAAEGERIYSRSCARCHGTPGPGGEYSNRTVPIETVKTDRSRLDGLSEAFRKHYRDSWMGEYGKTRVNLRPNGYVAPPLDGVWATAPYFHNGSVPTLYHVLFPDERPTVWKVRDYRSYDHRRVGLLVEECVRIPDACTPSERRKYYDTTRKSMGHQGHTFADRLSRKERLSLLEYLKTL